jgi:hypothetical protein
METIIKTDLFAIATELAERIARFNISDIADLLSENGEYCIQNENDEIVTANKATFLNWLGICINEFLCANEDRIQLNYTIDQCIHCRIGNPVITLKTADFQSLQGNLGKERSVA